MWSDGVISCRLLCIPKYLSTAHIFIGASTAPAIAFETGIDSGDTAWILSAAALVLFMTLPGSALFYAGLVQSKNIVSVLRHYFAIVALMSILWDFVDCVACASYLRRRWSCG